MDINIVANYKETYSIARVYSDDNTHSKLFILAKVVDGELKILCPLVPSLKDDVEPQFDTYFEALYLEDSDIAESGLIYEPKYFYHINSVPSSYVKSFNINLELLEELDMDDDMYKELEGLHELVKPKTSRTKEPEAQEVVESTTTVVEPNNSEGSREVHKKEKKTDAIMRMIQERGQIVYQLGTIDSKLEKLKEEYQKEADKLKGEQRTCIEKIDTYDNCIRVFVELGDE